MLLMKPTQTIAYILGDAKRGNEAHLKLAEPDHVDGFWDADSGQAQWMGMFSCHALSQSHFFTLVYYLLKELCLVGGNLH